jgi:hypothetical protein
MKLGIIAHSLLAPTPIHAPSAVAIMRDCMPGVIVDNWGVDSNTNWRQLNSGQNALIAASKPDVLMICLQAADTLTAPIVTGGPGGVDGRTLAQITQDAAELFDWYKANIPNVRLIHLQEFGGSFATPYWVEFNNIVQSQRQWDGYSILNYENCVEAATLVAPTVSPMIDVVQGVWGHPSRITSHMMAAELLSSFGNGPASWFGLQSQVAEWSNVEQFIADYKAGDPYALSAARSLTT